MRKPNDWRLKIRASRYESISMFIVLPCLLFSILWLFNAISLSDKIIICIIINM